MSVEVPEPPEDRTILTGFRDAVGPDGETVAVRVTVPEKPLMLADWICDVPDAPLLIVTDVGLDDSEKSTTLTITWTEWVIDPMVVVTVTV